MASIEGITNTGITGITNTIRPISAPPRPDQAQDEAVALDAVADSGFGGLFKELIQNVKDTDAELSEAQYLLSTGQLDNPVQVGIAGYKAQISVSLLMQLRDRALSAYNEIKNMNV